ncbi:DUF1697 domain-containing protein [Notoacmeibacter marinus]|uniref:DUF1697 domain-containing protein n=1 Tax=Notoacmeibacter marinus TaxID=1876515 RepID=UPI000DF37AD0|nr:DUF1697 domain-containing protein [Notoacmeibacter marinus]
MKTLIALLRAVNVGGTGKLPMAELRGMAEDVGFDNVRTYIQSGNLVFSSSDAMPDARKALEQRLEDYAGKPVGVILRTAQEMHRVFDANPFPDAEPSKVGVLFLDNAPPPGIAETAKGQTDEVIEPGEREVYIHFPSGMGRTKLRLAAMSDGTVRNINTVRKLVNMATGSGSK